MKLIDEFRAWKRKQDFRPTFASIPFSHTYIIRRELFKNIQHLSPQIRGRTLDIGCGSKPYRDVFKHAAPYIGMDIQASGHSHTDSKVDVFYDGKHIPFPDNDFDSIVSFEVFEHIFNLPEVLQEINRVTRPGGHLLVSIPFAWAEHEAPFDFARYTSFGVKHLLESAGFKVIDARKSGTNIQATFQMLLAYLFLNTRPHNRWLGHLHQFAIIFPTNLVALGLNLALPKSNDYYLNNVVLAEKINN
jgi:SAM-dependent methyltransferase